MTVKTQGGKVITKGGKVSCGCCDTECCMYPFEPFIAGDYGISDLPDQIKFRYFNVFYGGEIEGTLNKLETPVEIESIGIVYYISDDSYLFNDPGGAYYQVPIILNYFETDQDRWAFSFTPEEFLYSGIGIDDNNIVETSLRSIRPNPSANSYICSGLIGRWRENLLIEDMFASTYSISGGQIVTRQTSEDSYRDSTGAFVGGQICKWIGGNFVLRITGYEWTVNSNLKIGFQNTPVGSYAGGFTVS